MFSALPGGALDPGSTAPSPGCQRTRTTMTARRPSGSRIAPGRCAPQGGFTAQPERACGGRGERRIFYFRNIFQKVVFGDFQKRYFPVLVCV